MLPILCTLLMLASAAGAYQILLDIDTDNDPATINDLTYDTTATVRIVLWPTELNEVIDSISFGLGGSCEECEGIHHYGVTVDWEFLLPDWSGHPGLVGSWNGITLLGCPAEIGFHELLEAVPLVEPFVVDAPVFIATLPAQKTPPLPIGCIQPAGILGAFDPLGVMWNFVQLGGPAIANHADSWQAIKAIYR